MSLIFISLDQAKVSSRLAHLQSPTVLKGVIRFMTRALANDMFVFSDELDEGDSTCPQCKDRASLTLPRVSHA